MVRVGASDSAHLHLWPKTWNTSNLPCELLNLPKNYLRFIVQKQVR